MPKRILQGVVVSDKQAKTVVVKVDVRRTKNYHAHDEAGHKVGDVVSIEETRPISRLKRWIVIEAAKA